MSFLSFICETAYLLTITVNIRDTLEKIWLRNSTDIERIRFVQAVIHHAAFIARTIVSPTILHVVLAHVNFRKAADLRLERRIHLLVGVELHLFRVDILG